MLCYACLQTSPSNPANAADGAGLTVEQRLIPKEPSYLIMNLAMSESAWAKVDPDLQYPAVMSVDHVRIWQRPGAINVGCDAPGFPTTEYISCNRHLYMDEAEKPLWKFAYCNEVRGTVSCCCGRNAEGLTKHCADHTTNSRVHPAVACLAGNPHACTQLTACTKLALFCCYLLQHHLQAVLQCAACCVTQDNQFLLGVAVSCVAVTIVSLVLMLLMRQAYTREQKLSEQVGRDLPEGLTPGRTPQEKIKGCYLHKGGPELRDILKLTRPGEFWATLLDCKQHCEPDCGVDSGGSATRRQ